MRKAVVGFALFVVAGSARLSGTDLVEHSNHQLEGGGVKLAGAV